MSGRLRVRRFPHHIYDDQPHVFNLQLSLAGIQLCIWSQSWHVTDAQLEPA